VRRVSSGERERCALGSRGIDEHVAVQGIEGPAGEMEAEPPLALVANDDAGDLVVGPVDG
jgi:hypothetical protein